MRNLAEVQRALSSHLNRTQTESQSAARKHAVADKSAGVLRKAMRHLEHKPLHTLNVKIGTKNWDEQPSENVPTLVAKALGDDLNRLTDTKSSSKSTIYVYESIIPGLFIRANVHHPLLGGARMTFALVGEKTA